MIDSSHHQIHITLPVHLIPLAITLAPDLPDDLLERLSTAPEPWEIPLWHRICPAHHLDTMITAIQSCQPILICSNANVDAAKQSCCAWTIWANETLWHGKGIVPRHWDDIYSSQSKAFGILTALMFLGHYLSLYLVIIPPDTVPITVYCDSASIITNITRIANTQMVFPNSTIEDNYNVYCTIGHALTQLKPLMIQFRHVKGHQN